MMENKIIFHVCLGSDGGNDIESGFRDRKNCVTRCVCVCVDQVN